MNKNNFELLLPVGQKEMALAAIHNGADAIFVGFPGFNARGRSYDFEVAELKDIIEICHAYGVKVNLAFNIVIFENELSLVVEALEKILPLKPDALIIQDLGLVRLVRKIAPDQAIHASTQMTVTNDLAINLMQDLNIKRFVLGRENSLAEIKLIRENTHKELEVFVHGALCVSYSGQCFTSETLGGRSANRGQCAQSCRFNYELIVDGKVKNNLDRNYLVSPQDLCGLSEIPELMKIGVESFKVEGRLKTPEYVASAARSYRTVIDQQLKGDDLVELNFDQLKKSMAVQYSRGFFSGWLHGVNHQKLVDGTFSAHRGALIGTITGYKHDEIIVKLDHDYELKNGDGVLWVIPQNGQKNLNDQSKESIEKGSFIFSVKPISTRVYSLGISNQTHLDDSVIGAKLYLNHDKEQKKNIFKSYNDKNFTKKIPINFKIQLKLNHPMKVFVTDGQYNIHLESISALQIAEKKSLTEELMTDEFSSLSGTIFEINKIDYLWEDQKNLFLSHKEIKQLRQQLTEKLYQLRKNNRVNSMINGEHRELFLDQTKQQVLDWVVKNDFVKKSTDSYVHKIKLNVLLRDKKQVESLAEAIRIGVVQTEFIDAIILDFEFGRDYSESLDRLKKLNMKVGLATTRILKPQEYQNLKNLKSLNPDVILVRNLGALQYYNNVNPFSGELRGDFSLNVTNHLTAEYLLNKNLKSLCVSYDLNSEQASALIQSTEAYKLEVTLHQSMPSFHMEHCVFAAFLSKGSSYKDCGKPCEKHKVQLKDQFGHYHWIKPDQECRNTMFNSKAQTAVSFLQDWKKAQLGFVRYEALDESGDELVLKINHYLNYLSGQQDLNYTLAQLATYENYGLSAGNLAKAQEYQSRKKQY